MVISSPPCRCPQRAYLMVELAIALAILATVLIPLTVSRWQEQMLCRAYYHRAVALEIVDGEMEALVAGEWRAFKPGPQDYIVHAEAARNLPAGRFVLTLGERTVRLEWIPREKDQGGRVVREANLPPSKP